MLLPEGVQPSAEDCVFFIAKFDTAQGNIILLVDYLIKLQNCIVESLCASQEFKVAAENTVAQYFDNIKQRTEESINTKYLFRLERLRIYFGETRPQSEPGFQGYAQQLGVQAPLDELERTVQRMASLLHIIVKVFNIVRAPLIILGASKSDSWIALKMLLLEVQRQHVRQRRRRKWIGPDRKLEYQQPLLALAVMVPFSNPQIDVLQKAWKRRLRIASQDNLPITNLEISDFAVRLQIIVRTCAMLGEHEEAQLQQFISLSPNTFSERSTINDTLNRLHAVETRPPILFRFCRPKPREVSALRRELFGLQPRSAVTYSDLASALEQVEGGGEGAALLGLRTSNLGLRPRYRRNRSYV